MEKYCSENPAVDTYEEKEKKHGRETIWKVKVYEVKESILQETWTKLSRFITVEKQVSQKAKATSKQAKELIITESISYRISDVTSLSAEAFAKGIRGHWGIENRVHWVKDVNFKEDKNRIKNINGAINMAILNTISLNYLRKNIDDSIKNAQTMFCQNLKELLKSIRS